MGQFPSHEKGGSHQDIESGGVHVPAAPRSQLNPAHLNVAPPSLETIIAIISIVWMIVAFLINLNYPINEGNKVMNTLSNQHSMFFYSIVIIGMAAFYLTSMWMMMIVGRYQPAIARNLILVILVLGVLVFTMLLYALLPNKFNWIVWFFFGLTMWVMLVMQGCECATLWTDKIRTSAVQGYNWATGWTDKTRTSVVRGYKWATGWTDKIPPLTVVYQFAVPA